MNTNYSQLLEMYKTNFEIVSPIDETIKENFFSLNDSVNVGQTILIIE